jgi:hypothetical protein
MKGKNFFLLLGVSFTLFLLGLKLGGDFEFREEQSNIFPYSFEFTFLKNPDLNGYIALDDDGKYASIFLEDRGKFIRISFKNNNIVSYVINDDVSGYEMKTYFGGKIFPGIFSREEKYKSQVTSYIVDYNKEPWLITSIDDAELEIDGWVP